MLIHNSENVSLIYIKKRKFIYTTVVGFTNEEEIKEAAKNLEKNHTCLKAEYLLVDASKFGTLRTTDFYTIINTIFPIFRSIGIKRAVVLKTSHAFGEAYLDKILVNVQNSEVRTFTDMSLAEHWLFYER